MVFSMMYELNFLIFVGTSYIRRVNVSFHKFAYYGHADLWGGNNNSAIRRGILKCCEECSLCKCSVYWNIK